nr:hypothetical protein GCM10025699_16070 [Microbacterium flavescens]
MATATVSTAVVAPLRLRAPRPTERDDLDLGVGEQGGDLAAEGGMPQDDDALHAAAELGIAQQRPVPVDEVAAEACSADDLGDEGPAAGVREHLGVGSGVGSGDDHRARPAGEEEGLLLGIVRHVGDPDAPATLIERTGCLVLASLIGHGRAVGVVVDRRRELRRGHAEPGGQVTRERFAVGKIEVHRPG